MAEYIEREAAYNAIVRNYAVDDQLRDLDKIPAADVREVVHGKWIEIIPRNSDYRGFMCNKCGAQFQGIHRDNFCGNCGARMDGDA